MPGDTSAQQQPGSGNTGGEPGINRLVVPNSLSEIRRVSEWVHGYASEQRLARELVHALELSVNEALANIISYAYRDDARHDISVELYAQPDRIRVVVEDDGAPFNPLDQLIELPPQSLEKSRPTGRGIPLMRNLMDELRYTRCDNKNVLTMVMHRTRP